MKITSSQRAFSLDAVSQARLHAWLDKSPLEKPSTSNQAALGLPFQRWFKFKEAFAPSFVVECVKRLPYHPSSCLDPFGGSGTTALTCQFLGIKPSTIEVNPFIADIVEAKLSTYDIAELKYAFRTSARRARVRFNKSKSEISFPNAPTTLVEPGVNGRWIFGTDVAQAIAALRDSISEIADETNARLLKIILGSQLIDLSNVLVNGKGRRYRRSWERRTISHEQVFASFEKACLAAISDIECFRHRSCYHYNLQRGDARAAITNATSVDFILTSPPYPNSFDYTDIYNVELWTLGYLSSGKDNRELRESTLRSHVQIYHPGSIQSDLTCTLKQTYQKLCERRSSLWNKNIPEMVCHYFSDMQIVLKGCRDVLNDGGHMMLALGDSRYSDVLVDVPKILIEIAMEMGFKLLKNEAVRSMRSSAQQGGARMLNESLLWLSS